MGKTDRLLEMALEYIAGGLMCHPVFGPNHPDKQGRGKSPKVKKWQERRLTADEFQQCYKPGDNLGVVTGKASGLLCVDIDKKHGGEQWFALNEPVLGNFLLE